MAYRIGPTLVVGGEREFSAAMAKVRENMKYVTAEANAAMSAFDKNEKSVESLTAKNNTLKKALELQETAIKETEAALERMRTQGVDPASKAYKSMQANLDNATAAANQTKREIKENEQAMSALGETGLGLGDALDKVTSKLGISLPDGAKESLNSMATLDTKMLASIAVFAAVASAIYKVEEALVDMTLAQAAAMDEIATQSIITGISTEQLQKYAYAAELVDVPLETITSSMSKMIRTMDSARDGSKNAADAFRQLGVRVTSGNGVLRDSEVVFGEVIDRLGKVRNETERDAIAMQIFGKSARDLNPLIKAGSKELEAFGVEAEKMGYILDDAAAEKLLAVDDALQRFKNQMTTSKNLIAVEFAPALEKLIGAGQKVFESLTKFATDSGLIDIFASLIELVAELSPLFEVLADVLNPIIKITLKPFALALAIVADAITMVVSAIGAFIEAIKLLFGVGSEENLNRFARNFDRVFSNKGATATVINNLFTNNIPRYASGTSFHPGGLAIVGERGPETVLLPRGSAVLPNGAAGGSTIIYQTVNSRDMSNAARFCAVMDSARQRARAGGR